MIKQFRLSIQKNTFYQIKFPNDDGQKILIAFMVRLNSKNTY